MEHGVVKSDEEIFVGVHPHHIDLNKKIIEESKSFPFVMGQKNHDGSISNVRAPKTSPARITSRSIELVYGWIEILLNQRYKNWNFQVYASWLAKYSKDQHTVRHHHIPASFSFVYFVKSPKGSSPLILTTSRKRIKPDEGKVVIFPGSMVHHVPKNKCDGRITLAGNILPDMSHYLSK